MKAGDTRIPEGLTVIAHPLLARALTRLRDVRTPAPEFRRLLDDASSLIAWEVTRTLSTRSVRVDTPLAPTRGVELARPVILVPVLRAGVGMLDAFLRVVPDAAVGFVGQRRDEATLRPHTYLSNLPARLDAAEVIVLDPMLATGGSAVSTFDQLTEAGARRLRLATLLAAPEGVQNVLSAHPGTRVYTAALDRRLDRRGYIFPGLGDAGDRCFGT